MSKQEADRLADAMERDPEATAMQPVINLLRQWPDGEPVAWRVGASFFGHYDSIPSALLPPVSNPEPLYTAPPAESERIAALEAENAKLLDAVADKVSAATMLTGMTTGPDGLRVGLEGGAASLLAEMLAKQFKDGGGINYLELSFVSREAVPGDAFIVTVQRVHGKTPHALRAEAEAKHAALESAREVQDAALAVARNDFRELALRAEKLESALEQARLALEVSARLGVMAMTGEELQQARAALRAIEEVQR